MTAQRITSPISNDFSIDYGWDAEREINRLQEVINQHPHVAHQYSSRWLAIKLLESDEDIRMRIQVHKGGLEILTEVQNSTAALEDVYGDDMEVVIADRRYSWINNLVREAVQRPDIDQQTTTDKIDRILTHRILGIPIFLVAMWVVFKLTADVSAPYLEWVDMVINGPLTHWVVGILIWIGLDGSWIESLLVDGIIAGVGGVMVFVPVLMTLYLALAILEDSGYMARAAFVMDRLMHNLGLHGKSFLPMLVGFGCNVPAIYATRTLENEKDRILTGLLIPFMSCGARLPVYVLFSAIFFPHNAGLVIFSMYLIGILTAILLGLILKKTLFKGKEQSTFVMELPPYRLPTPRSIWFHMWERTSGFVRKAWTIILVTSVILWALMAIPIDGSGGFAKIDVGSSAFASVSRMIAPVMAPLGFDSWEASSALFTGFVAKEVVVSTLAQAYAVEEASGETEATNFFQDLGEIGASFMGATVDTLKAVPSILGIDLSAGEEKTEQSRLMHVLWDGFETSSGGHGALAGLAFMVFVLIYTPCMVAAAAERHELGRKWMWFSAVGQFLLAWVMAFIVFQGGILLGLG